MRTLVIFAALSALFLSPLAVAADTASRSTFVKLMDVQELWEEDRYDEAVAKLEELIESTRDRPYDYAVANQYLAHTAVMMGQQERSREPLEAALSVDGLPDKLVAELKMFYAQILLGDEEFALAKREFDEWLALTEEPPKPGQLFSLSYANYMTDHFDEAYDYITRAVAESPNPPENWLRLQYQILFDRKDYDLARAVAVDLLDRDPDNEQYWRLLASHHLRLEDYPKALAAAEVALKTGGMQKEADLRRIASLYGQVAAPERAAVRLAAWMDEGKVEVDAKTWRQLGDLWMLARERDNAKTALWNSVELEPNAQALEFLASIHFEDAEWEESYTAFEHALRLSDAEEDDLHRLEMLTGLTAMRAGHRTEAREFLLLAQQSEELRGQVRTILRELDKN